MNKEFIYEWINNLFMLSNYPRNKALSAHKDNVSEKVCKEDYK